MILVVGATGLLGGTITRKLLAANQPVRCLKRSNPAAQALIDAGAEASAGDLRDRVSLDRACQRVDVVITTALARFIDGGTLETVDLQGTKSLIDSAKAAGVKHFIYTSVFGADPDSPAELMRIKAEVEAYLRDSGIPYTILRPAAFMEIWIGTVVGIPLQAGQPVTLIGQGDHRHHFVSVNDVAEFAVQSVNNPRAMNQTISIGSTRATWTEVVETVARVTGIPIPIQYVPIGVHLPMLPEFASPLLWGMEMYESQMDMSAWLAMFDVKLETIEEYSRRMFQPQP